MRVPAHLTLAKLKSWHMHALLHSFGVRMLASEHTLHTRDARHERELHEPRTLHVWCRYSRCR